MHQTGPSRHDGAPAAPGGAAWYLSRRMGLGYVGLALFLLTQVGDGVLTYIGVGLHGVRAEANPLAAHLMVAFGLGPTVAGTKLATSLMGVVLHTLDASRALALVTAVYLATAIVPWFAVLLAR